MADNKSPKGTHDPGPPEPALERAPRLLPEDADPEMALRPSARLARTSSTADKGITTQLEQLQANLSALFADHRQKVLEYKVVVSEGITQAVGVLDMQSERIVELLKTNQELTRAVTQMAGQINKHESLHIDLEHEIVDLRERRDTLLARTKSLQDERNTLSADVRRASEENRSATEANESLLHQSEKLDRENATLHRETQKLEKERDRLTADVERLSRMRQEYMDNIKRYRDEKDGLTKS